MELRPYQQAAIDGIKDAWFNKGHRRVLLHAPTGSGKTVIFSYILSKLTVPSIMAVHGRKLVDQASRRLDREQVKHGVLMAGHWKSLPKEICQVVSIDTASRRQSKPPAQFVIVDEAHQDYYAKFLAMYPESFVLGVTATPYNRTGLDFDTVVKPTTTLDLIHDGYLVRPRYFPPHAPDVSNVRIRGGEFDQRQLAAAVDKGELIGDIVQHYILEGQNRSALCFAVNVNHSKKLAQRFRDAGINAEHCDANTPDDTREAILKGSESGSIKIICNVGIWTTGVDMPWISCIIDAAPTWSLIRYVQKLGRGTRPYPDKEDFIILDHGGNIYRHGPIEIESEAILKKDLQLKLTEKKERIESFILCASCFAAYRGFVCPACGAIKKTEIKIEHMGKLKEIKTLPDEQIDLILWKRKAKEKGYKRGWVYHQFKEKYPDKVKDYFKRRVVPDWVRQKYAQSI